MSKETTYGLKPELLSRLLSVGAGASSGSGAAGDREIGLLLHEHLMSSLPRDPTLRAPLRILVQQMAEDIEVLAGRPLAEILCNPETPVGLIQAVKEYAKRLCTAIATEPEHTVAMTIYYAAIASALAYHDEKVSRHSYKTLHLSFEALTEKPWMAAELKNVFLAAQKACREHVVSQ
ncbi:MAG: hypothetical protein ABFE13_14740 [Phycisphaerales bacterium]